MYQNLQAEPNKFKHVLEEKQLIHAFYVQYLTVQKQSDHHDTTGR